MNQDAPFRFLAVAGFLGVVAVALYHRIRSWASREELDRWQEGALILISLRAAGLVLWMAVIAYLVDPRWMSWSQLPIAPWLRWLGVGLLGGAIPLLAWTLRSLGTNLTDTVVTRREHTLVTHGPYRLVRHPFYGSVAVVILATALVAANGFVLLSGGVVLGLIAARTRKEEAVLRARFGEAYTTYMTRTGRFVPRWPID